MMKDTPCLKNKCHGCALVGEGINHKPDCGGDISMVMGTGASLSTS